MEYAFSIEEAGTSRRGRYRAVREGVAGRMRVDVYDGETRVYSEWWDGRQAWQLPQDAKEPVQSKVAGAEALRHGLEQPGHFWTLADSAKNGHRLTREGRDTLGGIAYDVLQLTLADGFTNWYWVNPSSCQIETVFEDFRTVRGVTRQHRDRTIDMATGETIGTSRIVALRFDPPFDPESLAALSPAPPRRRC